MTGYQSKRAAAQDKLDDDDIQVYQRPWVGIDWSEIPDEQFDNYHFGDGAKWAEQHLKEKNNG